MNAYKHLMIAATALIALAGCDGSDAYRGAWKATDMAGAKTEMSFDAKSFVVKDSLGHAESFQYTQNSVKIANGVKTYGINLSDGRHYLVTFPTAKDQSTALIEDEQEHPLYVISRNSYKTYNDVYKLK